jgi:hypothetical protein
MNIPIEELDCIFLTYDEPQKEEFWVRIKNIVPWAIRVDGVKGSDAAHKAAARASQTDRFVLIDGDNIPDADFFKQTLVLNKDNHDHVFRWRARNIINGLVYGNGGISCWTRDFVNNMRTHEATDGRSQTQIEFCFDPKYTALHNCYSTTYPNGSAFQAWRAGFREGVKMCTDQGARVSLHEFETRVWHGNLKNLCTWHNVGADVAHGTEAMAGARLGTYLTMCTEWDHTQVQSFDALQTLYAGRAQYNMTEIATILNKKLSLPIANLDADASLFFKYYTQLQHNNKDIMARAF